MSPFFWDVARFAAWRVLEDSNVFAGLTFKGRNAQED